ncbi:hypothetical protein MKEN_01371500 [Mycena kentingensis (nom. inval.)]|nr:hypothetical protein MKEN_01371500 [Mycena kentingensis (nom. inval.)]
MTDQPPTPVVHRPSSSARLISLHNMRISTEFRSSTDQNASSAATNATYPSFRPASALNASPDSPDVDRAGYMRVSDPISASPNARDESGYMRSSSNSRSRASSLEPIPEDVREEENYPPTSSSPRSSDPFFPQHESTSSPPSDDELIIEEDLKSTEEDQFVSQLHARLAHLSDGEPRSNTPDIDELSGSVTPDYPCTGSPNPNSFGPVAQRGSESPASFTINSCRCSECAGSGYSTRSHSANSASRVSGTGYEADADSPPTGVTSYPSNLVRADDVRSSKTATPIQLLSRTASAPKRSYSALNNPTIASPSPKKSKLSSSRSLSSARSSSRLDLARVPASLRKSLSLRSLPDVAPTPDPAAIPTEPNTPVARKPHRARWRLPIIAPPADHISRPPITAETAAKIRVGRFLSREESCRVGDKLDVARVSEGDEKTYWEDKLGIGPLRERAVRFLLEIMPGPRMYKDLADRWKRPYLERDGTFAIVPDLVDQLSTSAETRFHAAYIFLRNFYILWDDDEMRQDLERMKNGMDARGDDVDSEDDDMEPQGWNLVVWDTVIAALAISTKYHRDTLWPLGQIESWEFEWLPPHEVDYEQLETAQRDILSATRYRIGDSPQLLIDELWNALPSLRDLLNFAGGWNYTQRIAWAKLFSAVIEPDVLKFPLSHLTAAALVYGIEATIAWKMEYAAPLAGRMTRSVDMDAYRAESHMAAEEAAEGVVLDIQALVGIPDERLRVAREWIRGSRHYT